MPNLFPFGDPNDEERRRAQEELELASRARLSAASRALGLTPSAPHLARADSRPGGSNATAFMSMLGNDAAAAAASPYYQRQPNPYAASYVAQQSVYGSLQSPAEASLYTRRPGYGYGTATTDQAFQSHYRTLAGGNAHDFNAFYNRAAQDQATILDRAYLQQRREEEAIAAVASASPSSPSVLTASQTKSQQAKPEACTSKTSPGARRGKGGRGTAGPGSPGDGRGGGKRGSPSGGGAGPATSKGAKSPSDEVKPESEKDDKDDESDKWFTGSAPLGLPEDKYWLSELQVFLRSNFAEVFGATEGDIAAPMHGRNKPIALGQVGVRCVHCKDEPPTERGQQATSYPSLISGIYNSVQQMLRLHFDCCLSMPAEVRSKIESLKVSSSARGGRKQYWIDSAKRLGLVDTSSGIHFARDPSGPLPPLTGPLGPVPKARKSKPKEAPPAPKKTENDQEEASKAIQPIQHLPPEQLYPLVLPEDKDLISDYLYLTLEQMQPCNLMEADKVGCYKGRKVGFPGLACKHCVGQAGSGRYFPASEASLSQTTTSQTIMNHVRNCRRCPIEIRENLELMKRARMGPEGKRAENKPKHGGRKVFFHRLWCRIQRLPIESEDEAPERRRRKSKKLWVQKRKSSSSKKPRRRQVSSPDDTITSDDSNDKGEFSGSSEEDTETEESGSSDEESDVSEGVTPKPRARSAVKKKPASTWHHGCVRLTKPDDPHWCSEMQCLVRSDLVELFSLKRNDRSLDGYQGRKEPQEGQVGLRCAFCKEDPGTGSVYFPDSLSSIHTKAGDLVRLHFPCCPRMPDDVKETFRSLRAFGVKDESHQYWIDSARDIGLSDISPCPGGWGITFRRDPMQPSPADDIDRENAGTETYEFEKSSLIRATDRGLCTDQVMLLLRQVKACRFKKTDRRGGPSSRGRDRVIGFPGLCCKYCTTKANNFGRYFPVSAKNLTDNTANSLLSHVSSCSRCPEPIRASLAYLSHRSILQKAELSSNWKKTFFKRVWDRLHVERAWSSADGAGGVDVEVDSVSSENQVLEDGSRNSDNDEEEAVAHDMADMIKAAAVWLSEQESTTDTASRTRTARGRALPSSKRPNPFMSRGRGRGTLPSSKRRRVAVSGGSS